MRTITASNIRHTWLQRENDSLKCAFMRLCLYLCLCVVCVWCVCVLIRWVRFRAASSKNAAEYRLIYSFETHLTCTAQRVTAWHYGLEIVPRRKVRKARRRRYVPRGVLLWKGSAGS